ncbi:ABC transporter substrate-binding protein [Methylobacterium sp. B4]|uniref:ABC transporter substrate-binding protein n=1 Tax=Methylobacterium sp. B4 TaxID=1938755 RepID=UPI000D751DD5|nr:ABC transporter substrate-binding protein [Methylobacterium sp. B4]PXW53925.1 dipeptide transport system substrate-binding protein [Methylobacterium sp. B4]
MKRFLHARAALFAALSVLLAGTLPGQARTLVYCSEGNPESLDPGRVTTTTAMNVTWQMFNNLVEFVPGTTDLRPALAESWQISDGGRTYDFTLRADVRFHANARFVPSRPLNADDVLFSFRRQWQPDHPYHRLGGTFAYFRDLGLPGLIEGIERLDERRVRFRLKEPDATFLPNLAQAFGGILSAEYAEQLAARGAQEELARAPVGTGPFRFVDYRPDLAVQYRRFPEYWRETAAAGSGSVEGLVFSITPNAAVRLTKLKAGECHLMAFPGTADLEAVRTDPNLALLSAEELNVAYLALNTTRPPMTDLRVRRAVSLAIDRRAIVESVYGPAGTIARNPLPPGSWAFHGGLPQPGFDGEAARRLMAEAGFPDGFETDLWFLPVSRPYNPDGRRVADMIRADLARIGIRVRLTTRGWNEYRAALYGGEPTMMLYGWTSDNGDPDNFMNVLLGCRPAAPGGANLARWCDPRYDAAVQEARRTDDRDTRTRLYREAQTLFHEASPWVPLAHTVVHMAARRGVAGFRMDPLGRHLFEGVTLKE